MRGLFVSFEGLEGGGKTTVIGITARRLRYEGFLVVETREPGGPSDAEAIRERIFAEVKELPYIGFGTLPDSVIAGWIEAQASNVKEIIKPALEDGKIVLCDRYSGTSIAFYVYGAGRPFEQISELNRITTQGIVPDLTLFFDLPLELGLARKGYTYNDRTMDFYRDVERGYQLLYENGRGNHWRRVDATRIPGEVEAEVWRIITGEGQVFKRGCRLL